MGNKVAASFGVIMAIFIVLALTFWSFSAFKHSPAAATADIEMQVPVLPRVPERARTRAGPARVSRIDRVGRFAPAPAATADRVEFCEVPLSPPPRAPRGAAAPAGFF
ncbi:hypothetical protein D6D28_04954 [Aureobasidium pullulans]|uniref:Uncharacterized protein n=1 Tax=Aureobasidium pullulans TaxID=5580 RepID=A0A4S8SJ11_AURPU|nr:hypothetical protein D6D28_04954 [Aureobasidium pullulans]